MCGCEGAYVCNARAVGINFVDACDVSLVTPRLPCVVLTAFVSAFVCVASPAVLVLLAGTQAFYEHLLR